MNETVLVSTTSLNISSRQELRGGKMTIPTDIVAAFVLLVIFNFAMNLFLFYKWHKEIVTSELNHHKMVHLDHKKWEDEYKQSVANAQESNPLI